MRKCCEDEACRKVYTVTVPVQYCNVHRQVMLKVMPLHVSDTTIDYTYQDSEEAFPFYMKSALNQECV